MIYPTVMAFIAKRYPTGSDTAVTFTVTLMGVGSVIGNYVIGLVSESVRTCCTVQIRMKACLWGCKLVTASLDFAPLYAQFLES